MAQKLELLALLGLLEAQLVGQVVLQKKKKTFMFLFIMDEIVYIYKLHKG